MTATEFLVSVSPAKAKKKKAIDKHLSIPPPNFKAIKLKLEGTTPLVQRPIGVRHRPGQSFYLAKEGWRGIPTYGIRQSFIGACRLECLKFGKMPFLGARPDGFDVVEGTPMVKITKGKPRDAGEVDEKFEGGLLYDAGWRAVAVIEFDADWFKPEGLVKLMSIAGAEIGLGRLRPNADWASHRREGPTRTAPCYDYGCFSV